MSTDLVRSTATGLAAFTITALLIVASAAIDPLASLREAKALLAVDARPGSVRTASSDQDAAAGARTVLLLHG